MKAIIPFLFILISNWGVSQLPETIKDYVDVYSVEEDLSGLVAIKIPVNFNESNPLKNIPDSIKDLTIQRIDLVYTTNTENPAFDQEGLNNSRMKTFLKKFPNAGNDLVAWREVGQYSAKNRDEAKNLFHGFVIYYRPTPSSASMKKELEYIDEMLGLKTKTAADKVEKVEEKSDAPSTLKSLDTSSTNTNAKPVYEEGMDMLEYSLKTVLGDYDEDCYVIKEIQLFRTYDEVKPFMDSISHLTAFLGYTYSFNTIGEVDESKPNDYTIKWAEIKEGCDKIIPTLHSFLGFSTTSNFKTDYEIVETVFNRNANWMNALVVMDVTGSMSPYIGQTMTWLKERAKSDQITAFVFFNDGDSKPSSAKKMGSVGGVYMALNKNFDDVYDRMKYTMMQGGGGDCPENNVEATIKGIKAYPDSEEIVMVADNWATPRDLALVKSIGKPVHVILCGAYAGVNIEYLQLAYDTGGSVHTIEEDMNMAGIKPNKTFQLGNKYFTLVGGKIIKAENKY